jgi:pyridoxal phosphate enzyme (YggS family)
MIESIKQIRDRISTVLARTGRTEEEVTLVAVTKGVSPEYVVEAYKAGLRQFGENRIQEASSKIPELPKDITWHMIGHLQRNKTKEALKLFDIIESVDSERLAVEISRRAEALDVTADVLIQVNTAFEATKFGIEPSALPGLLDSIAGLEHIEVHGLMTIGPFTDDTDRIRRSFRLLRKLFEDTAQAGYRNVEMRHLSMGMTDDFEIALEEGATILRIGRAIFSHRTS